MAIVYVGLVEDPANLKIDDLMCNAEIRPGDLWFACKLERHSSGVQHESDVLGEVLKWWDSGSYRVLTTD